MKTVTIDRAKLLETLKKNREQHVGEYQEAHDAWRKEASSALRRAHRLLEKTGKLDLNLPTQPTSFAQQYDAVIRMAEMSVDTNLILEYSEFQQYIMDEWHWKHSFNTIVGAYMKK